MRYKSKAEFETRCEQEWKTLWKLVDELSERQVTKRTGSGRNARSVKDHLAHLHCWHKLLLAWHKTGSTGGTPDMPAKGFNWGQIKILNQQLFEEYKPVPWSTVKRKLKLSHGRIMKLVRSLNNSEFMVPGKFNWTGNNALRSYIGANMDSHYRWAIKKIKKAM